MVDDTCTYNSHVFTNRGRVENRQQQGITMAGSLARQSTFSDHWMHLQKALRRQSRSAQAQGYPADNTNTGFQSSCLDPNSVWIATSGMADTFLLHIHPKEAHVADIQNAFHASATNLSAYADMQSMSDDLITRVFDTLHASAILIVLQLPSPKLQ